jgi:hypothetical protein
MNDGFNFLAGLTLSQEKERFSPTEEGFSAKEKSDKIISNGKRKSWLLVFSSPFKLDKQFQIV